MTMFYVEGFKVVNDEYEGEIEFALLKSEYFEKKQDALTEFYDTCVNVCNYLNGVIDGCYYKTTHGYNFEEASCKLSKCRISDRGKFGFKTFEYSAKDEDSESFLNAHITLYKVEVH